MPDAVPAYYTPKEVAVLLRVSTHTIYAWIRAGTLSAIQIGQNVRFPRYRIAKEVVEARCRNGNL